MPFDRGKNIGDWSEIYVFYRLLIDGKVKTADSQAENGDAVLLSPACASWGMFPNYEERGRIFKEIVNGLEE